jgi:hypothetical protein
MDISLAPGAQTWYEIIMKVVAASEPRPGHQNEDFLLTTDRLVVVLDGCGIPQSLAGGVERGCVHGVPWYVGTLGPALARNAADPAVPLADALAAAIELTRDAHAGSCDLANPDTPACTVTVLRERDGALDHLVLSDSCVVLDLGTDTGDDLRVLTDHRVESAMPAPVTLPLDDPRRAAVDRARSAHRADRLNRAGGYWIASTDPAAAAEALTGTVPTARVRRAMLATDGGVRLVEFGELTFAAALDIAGTDGPAALIARTREAEAADPRATRWPRGKQYDDATVAYCTFPADMFPVASRE